MCKLSLFLAQLFLVLPILAQQSSAGPLGSDFGIHNAIFTIRLLSPISTKTARAGDTFTAQVETPTNFENGIIEGRVVSLKKPPGGFGAGKAEVQLEFDTLSVEGRTESITADLRDVANSTGVKSVDDEGHVIGRSSGRKRLAGAAGGAAAGALIGVLRGGTAGGILGAAAGGLVGYLITAKLTAESSAIEFRPGSVFTLTVSDGKSRRAQ
jgi:hypothetical protein